MNNEMIKLTNVGKEYLINTRKITVFNDLNLEINPNDITVLIGKSGSGKTTLLRLLAGLESPTSGTVHIPESLHIGMVFQEPRLMPWLTIEKNVTLGMKNPSKKETDEILKLVGLEGFEKAYPSQLSGGMKQRVALARTLIRKSNLILMDEPFASLDAFTKKTMQQELLRIKKETNAGIVFVTHDMSEATTLGDRIVTIKENVTKEVSDEKE